MEGEGFTFLSLGHPMGRGYNICFNGWGVKKSLWSEGGIYKDLKQGLSQCEVIKK